MIGCNCFHSAGEEVILDQVAYLKGSIEMQSSVIEEIIEEANLFKKRVLVDKLQSHLSELQERLSPTLLENDVTKKKR